MAAQAFRFPAAWVQRVLKKAYKLTHRSEHWHSHHLWPYLSVRRGPDGLVSAITVLGRPVPLVSFNDAFKGRAKAYHVILSGPSVNLVDYTQLPDIAVMGVNGSIVLQDRFNIAFPLYCIIDRDFIHDRPDLVERIVGEDRLLFLPVDVLRYIYQSVGVAGIRCRFCIIENLAERAFVRSPDPALLRQWQSEGRDIEVFDAGIPLGFSFDPNLGWFDADTVAYAALQVLVWGGARTIYFHGLDITGTPSVTRFYEYDGQHSTESRLERNFRRLIAPSFAGAVPVLRQRGIAVYNLSGQSAIGPDIMPFKNWQKLNAKHRSPYIEG